MALKDVPNPRLWKERIAHNTLKSQSAKTVGELAAAIENEDQESIEVSGLLNLARANGFQYRLFLNEDPLKVNLVLEHKPSDNFIQQVHSNER